MTERVAPTAADFDSALDGLLVKLNETDSPRRRAELEEVISLLLEEKEARGL